MSKNKTTPAEAVIGFIEWVTGDFAKFKTLSLHSDFIAAGVKYCEHNKFERIEKGRAKLSGPEIKTVGGRSFAVTYFKD